MTRIVVPFMSPVSVNARRAASRIELLRASAVSRRRGRDASPPVSGERVAYLGMGASWFRRTTTK
jgi:hypothetical protein